MNISKFTEKAQEAILASPQLATALGHAQVEPEHLLLALVEQREGVVPTVLQKVGQDPVAFAAALRADLEKLPKAFGGAEPHMSPRLRVVADAAEAEAKRMQDDYVSTEHLLIGIVSETGRSPAAQALQQRGITRDRVLEALTAVRGSQRVTDPNPENKYQALERYGRDLTELARRGKLDPGDRARRRSAPRHPGALAPHQEQPRAHRRARRRQDRHRRRPGAAGRPRRRARGHQGQAHPRPGHGLARGRREVPRRVRGAAQGRAQGDRRFRGQIVLFIDELHTVVGAGAAEGSLDASNMLKPMLARGELHTIGATTLDEYRKHIEKDAALERRFQPVMVGEPTVEDTISILRGLRERYEIHHGVKFKDSALVAAAVLSHRYIADRFPARQGDRPGGRGRVAPAHGDRLDAGRARRGAPAHHAARDRARGARQGNR
jgi:ATP-dependent Clp protease ATP-binding subunit ClpB